MGSTSVSRQVVAGGLDPYEVAESLADQLRGPGLRFVMVAADWRLDPQAIAATIRRALPAPSIGCTTMSPLAAADRALGPVAAALGLYGDWLRVGIGVAPELPKSALARSRDAVHRAAAALGTTTEKLDSARHVAITLVDGRCGHEEAFCIGSAAAAPQIRFAGGGASTEVKPHFRPYVWCNGEVLGDAGIIAVLETALPFQALTSSHLVPTDVRTVVTSASGRVIDELDGSPAGPRLHELVEPLGGVLVDARPTEFSLARVIAGVPYVRSLVRIEGNRVHLASAIEPGHVLRVMRPGDLIATTRRDLAAAKQRVGGSIGALIAFSCIARHWEAAARGLEGELAATYAAHPTFGFQTMGEQHGMLLVNHTLTGLAIGEGP